MTPAADEARSRARWLVMGAVMLLTTAGAGGSIWLVRPPSPVAISPLPPPAAATVVAAPAPVAPPQVAPRPARPEPTAPPPPPPAVPEALPKTASVAPPTPLPRISPSAIRREEPIAVASAPIEVAPAVKPVTPPHVESRSLPDDLPVPSPAPPRVKAPDPSLGLFRLGVLYQQAADHRRAIEQYRALLAIDARHVPALNNLAVSLRHLGELKEATEVLQRATALDPTYDKAFTNLGVVQQLQERPGAAIEAHLRALAINGQNWESAFNLGLLFWEANDPERASQFFHKVIALRSHASAYYYLGLIAERQGRLSEAVHRYRQALQQREGAPADLTAEAERRLQDLLGQVRR